MRTIVSVLGILLLGTILPAQPPEPGISRMDSFVPDEKTIYYQLGESQVPIKIYQYDTRTNIFFINLHDNESTSVEAAKNILQYSGGTLLKIENNSERIINFRYRGGNYAFDPNRIFSKKGIEESLKKNGRSNPTVIIEVEKFANRILELIPDPTACIVALHNNNDEGFSIHSYMKGGEFAKDARKVSRNKNEDPDDIVLTTDETLYKKLSKLGLNCILQDNKHATKDGSLSVWSGENRRRYINIETEHGKLNKYVEMMKKVLKVLE